MSTEKNPALDRDSFEKLITKINNAKKFSPKAASYLVPEICERWSDSLKKQNVPEAQIQSFLKENITESVYTFSDNIPDTKALNNKFFDLWNSSQKLDFATVRKILVNYIALTDMTRHAVALSYLASHGNIEEEVDRSQNLHEENGSGNVDKAHIKLLYLFATTLLEVIKGEKLTPQEADLSPTSNKDIILPSTNKGKEEEEDLYLGKTVDGVGITKNLIRGDHTVTMQAAIAGVAAAHEGKAPGMLLKLFEGCIKYLDKATSAQKTALRKYFDEHLGEEMVDAVIDRETLPQEKNKTKFSQTLKEENLKVKGVLSEQLRDEGKIEQAHRKDANDAVCNTIFKAKDTTEMLQAYTAAINCEQEFVESHGKVWEGIFEDILNIPRSKPIYIENPEKSYNHSSKISPKKRAKEFEDMDPETLSDILNRRRSSEEMDRSNFVGRLGLTPKRSDSSAPSPSSSPSSSLLSTDSSESDRDESPLRRINRDATSDIITIS
jgi:hypothetical protein